VEIVYDRKNELFRGFVEQEKLETKSFQPWCLAPFAWTQSIIYTIMELIENQKGHSFDRELIKMRDGGTCGIDWENSRP